MVPEERVKLFGEMRLKLKMADEVGSLVLEACGGFCASAWSRFRRTPNV